MWANVAVEIATGKTMLVTSETKSINLDRYERHVIPCTEDGEYIVFGVHNPRRNCNCRPKIVDDQNYEIVVHQDRKPN